MDGTRLTKVGRFLLVIAAAQMSSLPARVTVPRPESPTLQEFFQSLVEHYNPSKLPADAEVMAVTEPVSRSRPEDISKALPAIFAALARQDDRVKMHAAAALIAVALRRDSAALLRKYINPITDLLASPNERLQRIGVTILGYLQPAPPPEVLPPLLAFLKRPDSDPQAQVRALFVVLRPAPEKPELVAVILEFLDRPLDQNTRIDALNGLGTMRSKDPYVIDKVIASLDDPDPGIRSRPSKCLPAWGPLPCSRRDRHCRGSQTIS